MKITVLSITDGSMHESGCHIHVTYLVHHVESFSFLVSLEHGLRHFVCILRRLHPFPREVPVRGSETLVDCAGQEVTKRMKDWEDPSAVSFLKGRVTDNCLLGERSLPFWFLVQMLVRYFDILSFVLLSKKLCWIMIDLFSVRWYI